MQRRDLMFRVFVSSTFSDLVEERNALQERVFPRLREYCQQRAAKFQAIDLRWGVARESSLDQQTMNICRQELKRCQQISPRPNFIVLLGNRYGWRPLPPQIDADEFESFLEHMADDERALLRFEESKPSEQPGKGNGWYRRDDNAVPAKYCLLPREAEFADSKQWSEEESRLREILLSAVQPNIPRRNPRRKKYEESATHQEIRLGALDVSDADNHVFCYFREIEGLPDGNDTQLFRDIKDGCPDEDAAARLESLKKDLLAHVKTNNVRGYVAKWTNGKPECDLDVLCADVEEDLKRVIDEELSNFEETPELEREINAHQEFGRIRVAHFVGRHDILESIAAYIQSEDSHPLVIYGCPGSGKTALMAKAMTSGLWKADCIVVSRFIGATPGSSDLRSLLTGLCQELVQVTGDDSQLSTEMPELVREFSNRLTHVSSDRSLTIFLDALDQLSAAENALSLYWLPRALPPGVKLIVSVLNADGKAGECFRTAQKIYPAKQLKELGPLAIEHGESLLDAWLDDVCRRLRPVQRNHVLARFAGCPYPLYLKLAYEETRQWSSYDGLPSGANGEPGLSQDIPGILGDLFWRLEQPKHHGKILSGRSLGYLAAARHGLSEDELLDVLSADDEVMKDFQQRSPDSPPVDRLPVIAWSRLFADLEPYLTQRDVHGARLHSFYHRQVGESVAARYLDDDTQFQAHRHLANYFDRHDWPRDVQHVKDLRALNELPYHQTRGVMWDQLEQTLCNQRFVDAKCKAGMTFDLIADYAAALSAVGDNADVDRFMHIAETRLGLHPNVDLTAILCEAIATHNHDAAIEHFRTVTSDAERVRILTFILVRSLAGAVPASAVDDFILHTTPQIETRFKLLDDGERFSFDLFRSASLVALRDGRSAPVATLFTLCDPLHLEGLSHRLSAEIGWNPGEWSPEIHGVLIDSVRALPDGYQRAKCGMEILDELGHLIPDDQIVGLADLAFQAPDDADKPFILTRLGRSLVRISQTDLGWDRIIAPRVSAEATECFTVFQHMVGTLLSCQRVSEAARIIDRGRTRPELFAAYLHHFWKYNYATYAEVEEMISLLQTWQMRFVGYGSLFFQLADILQLAEIEQIRPFLSKEADRLKERSCDSNEDTSGLMEGIVQLYDSLHCDDPSELAKRALQIASSVLVRDLIDRHAKSPAGAVKNDIATLNADDQKKVFQGISRRCLRNREYGTVATLSDPKDLVDISVETLLDIVKSSTQSEVDLIPWESLHEGNYGPASNISAVRRLLKTTSSRGPEILELVLTGMRKMLAQRVQIENAGPLVGLTELAILLSDSAHSKLMLDRLTTYTDTAEQIIRNGGEGLSQLLVACGRSPDDLLPATSPENVAAQFLLHVFTGQWSAAEACLKQLTEPIAQPAWRETHQAIKTRQRLNTADLTAQQTPAVQWLAAIEDELGVLLADLPPRWIAAAARWGAGPATADSSAFVHEVAEQSTALPNSSMIPLFRVVSRLSSTWEEELKLRLDLTNLLDETERNSEEVAAAVLTVDETTRPKSYFGRATEWFPLWCALHASFGQLKSVEGRNWLRNGIDRVQSDQSTVDRVSLLCHTAKLLAETGCSDHGAELCDEALRQLTAALATGPILTNAEEAGFGVTGRFTKGPSLTDAEIDSFRQSGDKWSIGSILCACRVREAATRFGDPLLSHATDVMTQTAETLPTHHQMHWSEIYSLSMAFGILAEHQHVLNDPGVEESLRLSLDAALRINSPIDVVRSKALAELAERAVLTKFPKLLEEIVEELSTQYRSLDNLNRDRIYSALSRSLAREGRFDEVIHTVERMEDDNLRATALANVIRSAWNPAIEDWLLQDMIPRLDFLIPGIDPREELVTITGSVMNNRPDLLLRHFGNFASYIHAPWSWLIMLGTSDRGHE